MEINLSGKVALITGAESGIGKAIAVEFASLGCNLVLTYFKDKKKGAETLEAVQKKGVRGLLINADVSNEEDVSCLFSQAIKEYGQIDFLINSAGIRSFDKPLSEISFAEFDQTIKTNLYSVFLCCKYFVKHRLQREDAARIINITSIHSEVVSSGKIDYCSSKFAIKGFSKVLSLELATNQITVNCIAPGMILTPMNQRALDEPEYKKELEKRIPMKFAGLPEDVAKVAAFLVSDSARYITGTTQVVDGGLMLNRSKGAN